MVEACERGSMEKKRAIIVDVDGTIARMCDRGVYEHEKADKDTGCIPVIITVNALWNLNYKIIYCTGRFEKFRNLTYGWIQANKLPDGLLFMREDNDSRGDDEVKGEIYKLKIEPIYNVLLVLEDRNRVVKMWRDLGLTCFQVLDGDY